MYCNYCRSDEHTVTNCPSTAAGQANRRHMYCSYCGAKTHNIEACPKTWNGSAARVWYPDDVADSFVKDGEGYER